MKTDLEALLGSAGKMVQESRERRGTASPRHTDEQVGTAMPHPGLVQSTQSISNRERTGTAGLRRTDKQVGTLAGHKLRLVQHAARGRRRCDRARTRHI